MEDTRKPARKGRATTAAKPVAKPAPKAAAASGPARKAPAGSTGAVPPAQREELIRLAAYFRAERRGFAPGNDWEDWLAAEAEIGALVGVAPAAAPRKSPAGKAAKAPTASKGAKAPRTPKAPKA
jgi:hypothetical protein